MSVKWSLFMLGFVGVLALAINLAGGGANVETAPLQVNISGIDKTELERFQQEIAAKAEGLSAYELAVEKMEAQLVDGPQSGILWEELAALGKDHGELGKALEKFEAALMLDSGNLMLEFCRARALHLLERYDESVEGFNRVIQGDPAIVHAFFYRAYSYFDKGDLRAAEEDMSEFVALCDSEELKSHGKELLRHWKSVQ